MSLYSSGNQHEKQICDEGVQSCVELFHEFDQFVRASRSHIPVNLLKPHVHQLTLNSINVLMEKFFTIHRMLEIKRSHSWIAFIRKDCVINRRFGRV